MLWVLLLLLCFVAQSHSHVNIQLAIDNGTYYYVPADVRVSSLMDGDYTLSWLNILGFTVMEVDGPNSTTLKSGGFYSGASNKNYFTYDFGWYRYPPGLYYYYTPERPNLRGTIRVLCGTSFACTPSGESIMPSIISQLPANSNELQWNNTDALQTYSGGAMLGPLMVGQSTVLLKASGFGILMPDRSVLKGLTVNFNYAVSANAVYEYKMMLNLKGELMEATDLCLLGGCGGWSPTVFRRQVGGMNESWNLDSNAFQPEDFGDPDFGIVFALKRSSCANPREIAIVQIQSISISLYYDKLLGFPYATTSMGVTTGSLPAWVDLGCIPVTTSQQQTTSQMTTGDDSSQLVSKGKRNPAIGYIVGTIIVVLVIITILVVIGIFVYKRRKTFVKMPSSKAEETSEE